MTPADAQNFIDAHSSYQAYRVADASGGMLHLDALWREHSKPWLSPKRYRRQYAHRGGAYEVRDDGLWAEPSVALYYIEMLDHRLAFALNTLVASMFEADPVRHMIEGYAVPFVAKLAAHAARSEDESESQTRERIVLEVVDRTEALDEYARETLASVARRAFDPA